MWCFDGMVLRGCFFLLRNWIWVRKARGRGEGGEFMLRIEPEIFLFSFQRI